MPVYIGSSNKLKVNLGGTAYTLNLISKESVVNTIRLLSYDNYILKDSAGLYLTAKESD